MHGSPCKFGLLKLEDLFPSAEFVQITRYLFPERVPKASYVTLFNAIINHHSRREPRGVRPSRLKPNTSFHEIVNERGHLYAFTRFPFGAAGTEILDSSALSSIGVCRSLPYGSARAPTRPG
jgi:hypothetical protein